MEAHRRDRPLQSPTFAQTVAILRDVVRNGPTARSYTDLMELTKRRHVELGFHYTPGQIHRAIAALQRRPNKHSARST